MLSPVAGVLPAPAPEPLCGRLSVGPAAATALLARRPGASALRRAAPRNRRLDQPPLARGSRPAPTYLRRRRAGRFSQQKLNEQQPPRTITLPRGPVEVSLPVPAPAGLSANGSVNMRRPSQSEAPWWSGPGGGGEKRPVSGRRLRGAEISLAVTLPLCPAVARARPVVAPRAGAVALRDSRDALESFPKVMTRETLFAKTDLNFQNIAFKVSVTWITEFGGDSLNFATQANGPSPVVFS